MSKRKYIRRNVHKKIEKLVARLKEVSHYNAAKPYKRMFDYGLSDNQIQQVIPSIKKETGISLDYFGDMDSYPCADQVRKWVRTRQLQLNDEDSH